MPTSPDGRLLGRTVAVVALAAAALPALGQQRPESILPPGFGTPAAPARPTPRPTATRPPVAGAPTPRASPGRDAAPVATVPRPPAIPAPSAATAVVQPLPGASPTPEPIAPTPVPTPDVETLARHELPPASRRSPSLAGAAGAAETRIGPDAFAGADGLVVEALMRSMSGAPASRWLTIVLRRTLVSELRPPLRVNGADFAAERAWLLLRIGEADAARAVVQSIDAGDYTPKLYQVAINAMLATGDPAGLCRLADGGAAATGERGWSVAQAMCAAMAGQPARARSLAASLAKRRVAGGIDLALARKVIGAAGGGQAVAIDWDGVDRLTAWRFGLALATGVPVPAPLYRTVGPQLVGWRATAPGIASVDRLAVADAAATRGTLSAAALVDLYAAVAALDEPPADAGEVADRLRTAYTGTPDERAAALRALWTGGETNGRTAYGRLVLTAHAAARIAPAAGPDADRLVAAMLAAGLDRTAARWRPVVEGGGDAWAMTTLADPDLRAALTYRDLAGYGGRGDAALKQRLLFAGLAGLGRLVPGDIERAARALDVRIGAQNSWTRAIDRAARDRQSGLVILLAAIGMQTPALKGVPPAMLYRIIAALRAVGLEGEARMIAAEAIARA